jgi:hypothetical protein
LVENYPKNIEKLPDNLQEVQHRARDIMFSDKTVHNVQMSKAISYYLRLIDDLYKMLERHFDSEDRLKESTLLGAYLFAIFANALTYVRTTPTFHFSLAFISIRRWKI